MNTKEIYNALLLGIRDYFKKNGFKKAVIGLSGGIDSSVSACLAVEALGNKNVAAVLMPEKGLTSEGNINDALKLAKSLKINHYEVPINNLLEQFKEIDNILKNNNTKKNELALANAKARLRMCILYYFANLNNALVIGTSDKSEIALGYTTKYGDSAADILVIGDLWKTEAIGLGRFLNLPRKILAKKPSAELIANVDAERELGAPYEALDRILKLHIEGDLSLKEIISKGFDKRIARNVVDRVRLNEHKRRNAVLIRVSERSFHGMEWRMPITNKFKD